MLARKWGARGSLAKTAAHQAYRLPCPTCHAERDRRCKGLGDGVVHTERVGVALSAIERLALALKRPCPRCNSPAGASCWSDPDQYPTAQVHRERAE